MAIRTATIKAPSDVHYLTFQGGGGLGYAYLGAIEALEAPSINILPIRPGAPSQIKGVSGASVGAITAMLVALGCTSKDLKEEFSNKTRFAGFYDAPSNGQSRGVTPQDYHASVSLNQSSDSGQTLATLVKDLYKLIVTLRTTKDAVLKEAIMASPRIGGISPALVLAIAIGVGPTGLEREKAKIEEAFPFSKLVFDKPNAYLFNITNDRGIFPGFAVRAFLIEIMRKYLNRLKARTSMLRGDPGKIDFVTFKQVTGIDFVVTGTNLSQRRSQFFSADTTPNFPVVEAVGISACYPVVFKPIYIKAPENDRTLGKLRGLWVDGGLLNNFPIHAFDSKEATSRARPGLNPHVLGFMLNDGNPEDQGNAYHDPEAESSPLGSLAAGLLETALSPGNKGQLRTQQEESQMIPLYTFDLSLFDFSPPSSVSEQPLKRARSAVLKYFGK